MTILSKPASHLLDCYDRVVPADRDSCGPIDDLAQAGQIQDEIVAARVARGEKRLGYKIGFTNRTIWARYGVHHPIWGPVYDTTVTELDSTSATVSAGRFTEPRLEPEIVVRLHAVPSGPDAVAVAECVEWVAHGFEIVQSPFTGWSFSGPESMAVQGLHGALLIGPRVDPAELAQSPATLPDALAAVQVQLFEASLDGPVDEGVGTNVLDGPLHAIAHLVRELGKTGVSLSAGDIITTGTVTDAQPLKAGQQWRSVLSQCEPLQGLSLSVNP